MHQRLSVPGILPRHTHSYCRVFSSYSRSAPVPLITEHVAPVITRLLYTQTHRRRHSGHRWRKGLGLVTPRVHNPNHNPKLIAMQALVLLRSECPPVRLTVCHTVTLWHMNKAKTTILTLTLTLTLILGVEDPGNDELVPA